MNQKPRRRRRYRPHPGTPPEMMTTPRCPGCRQATKVGRTSSGGVYFRCEGSCPEFFVQLEELAPLMRRRYAHDLSLMGDAQKREFAKGSDIAVRALAESMEQVRRLHVPLAELE